MLRQSKDSRHEDRDVVLRMASSGPLWRMRIYQRAKSGSVHLDR
jgi:hypothetical protein